MNNKNITKLYRYEGVIVGIVGGVNGDDYLGSRANVYLHSYDVVKETKCGYWIKMICQKDKWVSKTSRKRFSYPSKSEAWNSFVARKQRQLEIYQKRCNNIMKFINHPRPKEAYD